jgi:Beta-lactamase enzyme family
MTATARRGLTVALLAAGLVLCLGLTLSRASAGAPVPALVPGPVVAGAVHPGPRTQALAKVVAYRHALVRLPFRVRVSVGWAATVTVHIVDRRGKVVAVHRLGRVRADVVRACRFTCRLAPGRYRYVVYAVDQSFTPQLVAGENALVVRQAFPVARAVARAVAYLKTREGLVGFAVVDSAGHLTGSNGDEQFLCASVIKAMLLVSYLRTHTSVDAGMLPVLTRMIEVSDNDAAETVFGVVGVVGLSEVAHAAGMVHFSASPYLFEAQITAADQARFFSRLDRLVPKGHRRLVHTLLSSIVSAQSWGIPATARPAHWQVFFKGGWRSTARGQLVHQVAWLRKDGLSFSMAVLTDGDPSMGYGEETIRGATLRLLGLAR